MPTFEWKGRGRTGEQTGVLVADSKDAVVNALRRQQISDTFLAASPDAELNESTFNGFGRAPADHPRIDWILCSNHFEALGAQIDRSHVHGRYPSDHVPVTAERRFHAD